MPTQHHPGQSITLDYADPRGTAGDDENQATVARSHGKTGHVRRSDRTQSLSSALGWFSVGLGLMEVATPRLLAQSIGVPDRHQGLIRLLGLRELASGLGILTQPQSASWVTSRVWGDMMDLALLGAAFAAPRTDRGKLLAATAAVAGVTMLDVWCSRQLGSDGAAARRPVRITKVVTVNRSAEDLYRFWRDFQNLPTVISHLQSVQVTSETRSHWTAHAGMGMTLEWDAEIVDDKLGERIAWQSVEGADMTTSGAIRFERAAGGRGTVVRVDVAYDPPAGRLGSLIATVLGRDPSQELQEGLRRFKQQMETGEIATTAGQPMGPTGLASLAT